jgi:hypothetical protein
MTTDNSPFHLDNDGAYQAWRAHKLADVPVSAAQLSVDLRDTANPRADELAAIREACERYNLCIYRGPADADKQAVTALGKGLGLYHLDDNLCADEDRITSLQVTEEGAHRSYIPYSDRALQWHTDGYYNTPEQQVRAVILHCVRPAAKGGENLLLDVELLYIALRDHEPALIAALQHPDALTIPANRQGGRELRPARSGPVFSCDLAGGALHMRYSARQRNIIWRDDADTRRAVMVIAEMLAGDHPGKLRVRLAPGEGLISNNALHNRSGFDGDRGRLLYRARYYRRVAAPCSYDGQRRTSQETWSCYI